MRGGPEPPFASRHNHFGQQRYRASRGFWGETPSHR